MENTQEHLLDEFSGEKLQTVRRRKLLPIWIRIFVWLFMITGVLVLPVLALGLAGLSVDLSLYGLETKEPNSPEGLLLSFLFLYKGVVAFFLWFERGPAVILGILDAILGIMVCLWVMFAAPHMSFRLDLVALVPYLYVLIRIRKRWEA